MWTQFQDDHIFGIPQSHVDQKIKKSNNVVQLNPDEDKYYLLTQYPTLMQSLKSFHPKASEPLLVTQILIYNQLEYILNQISNITLEHNNFKNY